MRYASSPNRKHPVKKRVELGGWHIIIEYLVILGIALTIYMPNRERMDIPTLKWPWLSEHAGVTVFSHAVVCAAITWAAHLIYVLVAPSKKMTPKWVQTHVAVHLVLLGILGAAIIGSFIYFAYFYPG